MNKEELRQYNMLELENSRLDTRIKSCNNEIGYMEADDEHLYNQEIGHIECEIEKHIEQIEKNETLMKATLQSNETNQTK